MDAAAGGPGEGARIVGRRLERERVPLGGRRFERCLFAGCELVLDGRPVQLVDNSLEGCRWSFEGAAARTLDLVAALCHEDPGLAAAIGKLLGLPGATGWDGARLALPGCGGARHPTLPRRSSRRPGR